MPLYEGSASLKDGYLSFNGQSTGSRLAVKQISGDRYAFKTGQEVELECTLTTDGGVSEASIVQASFIQQKGTGVEVHQLKSSEQILCTLPTSWTHGGGARCTFLYAGDEVVNSQRLREIIKSRELLFAVRCLNSAAC
jgi:hypothetical protein